MQIEIEVKRGQYRIVNGKVQQYAADYGYIANTKGADNEPIDVYRGLFPNSPVAFVINQYHNGVFDEHKVMLDFYDENQAINAFQITTHSHHEPAHIFPCTLKQLKWWLQYGNHKLPVNAQSFPFDGDTNMQYIDNSKEFDSQTATQLIYNWRKIDDYGELLEPVTLDDILSDEEQDGAIIDEKAVFDALAVPNKRLEKTAQLLGNAFNRASGSLKVVENGIHISAPMKKNGTTNIAVIYEMTDGQTVSVLFHNPDTTPAKIAPDDVLISWKWLLNRKDITIVAAKENGKDLPLPTVARRVMALVEKNTARFAKANANKAAETEELARLESEKAQKLARLEELNQMVDALNASGNKNGNMNDEFETQYHERKNEFLTKLAVTQEDIDKEIERIYSHFDEDEPELPRALKNAKVTALLENLEKIQKEKGLIKKGDILVEWSEYSRKVTDDFGLTLIAANDKQNGILGNAISVVDRFDPTKKGHIYLAIPKAAADAYLELREQYKREVKNGNLSRTSEMQPTENQNLRAVPFEDNHTTIQNNEQSILGSLKTEPLDESALEPLNVPENATTKEVRKALETYLKQLQGKTITTSDGKTVRFSGKSTSHLANDAAVKKEIMPHAISHVVDVLKTGRFIERQELYKERTGGFVAFHVYRKWIDLGNKEIHMQVKAGELANGILEAGNGLLAYATKDVEKAAMDSSLNMSGSDKDDQPSGNRSNLSTFGATSVSDVIHHTAVYDAAQDNEPYIFIEILEVRKKQSKRNPTYQTIDFENYQKIADKAHTLTIERETQKRNKEMQSIEQLQRELDNLGVQYQAFKERETPEKYKLSERLTDALDSTNKLLSGKISPQGIVGKGVRNPKTAAVEYLVSTLTEADLALDDITYDYVARANYRSYLQGLLRVNANLPNNNNPQQPDGKESKIKTAKGTEITTGFTVLEVSDLITSHDVQGNINPNYPQELQPRDRSRDSSIMQIKRMASDLDPDMLGKSRRADTGAPIIGNDRIVESGNGRTMAIREAYATGKAEEYRNWLIEEADSFGINPDKIRTMKQPILVRIRTSEIDRKAFTIEANQDDKLGMSNTEKAQTDMMRLTPELLLDLHNSEDLLAVENRQFIKGFLASLGDNEAAQYLTSDGKPTASLVARIQAAIFAKAYNDERLLELTADVSKPEIANILKALNGAATEFIAARSLNEIATQQLSGSIADSIEQSLEQQTVDAMIDAIRLVQKAKADGQRVDEAVQQIGLFSNISPEVAALAVFINQNSRSPNRLMTAFKEMAIFIKREVERNQTFNIFGDNQQASLQQIIEAANRKLNEIYGDDVNGIPDLDLFSGSPSTEPLNKSQLAHEKKNKKNISFTASDMNKAIMPLLERLNSKIAKVLETGTRIANNAKDGAHLSVWETTGKERVLKILGSAYDTELSRAYLSVVEVKHYLTTADDARQRILTRTVSATSLDGLKQAYLEYEDEIINAVNNFFGSQIFLSNNAEDEDRQAKNKDRTQAASDTKQEAINYLNQIINGEIDGMADGVLDRLLELIEPFENDAQIMELSDRATNMIIEKMPKDFA